MDAALYVFATFLAGVILGAAIANAKWRNNAKEPMRIESFGGLYKVYRVSPGQWHLDNAEYQEACFEASVKSLRRHSPGGYSVSS